MTEETGREIAEIGVRLIDDAYFAWFAAESECERALQAWLTATSSTPAAGYQSYRAALDREEAAANDLQRLLELAKPCEASVALPELESGRET